MPAPVNDSNASGERLIAYIDGFNLYHGLHDAAGTRLLWLDVVKLVKELRPASSLVQVKYFTARVLDEPDAQARQDRYIEALTALYPGRLTVVNGRFQRKPKRCRECGERWTSYEEKQTDVNIAVHLVADAVARRADTFLVISADTDVIPAIKMARQHASQATFLAQFPPRRQSTALARMLPDSRSLTVARVERALLPDVVKSPAGKHFHRPEKWNPIEAVTETEHACPALPDAPDADAPATAVPEPSPMAMLGRKAPWVSKP